MWKDNRRRCDRDARRPGDVLHKYPADYKVIFVGDASMSPYEITHPGGSVEHWNEEAGPAWLQRVLDIYRIASGSIPVPSRIGATPSRSP